MARQPLVLVFGASAGHGHMVAAQAVAQALTALRSDVEVEVHDILAYANPFFRTLYAGGYATLVRHAPGIMGWIYERTDGVTRGRGDALRVAFEALNTAGFRRLVRARRPDLVIHTHYLPAEMVAGLRRSGRLACPQVIVTTDFDTHRIWAQEPAERYYTATRMGAAYLQAWGIGAERVRVTGIPVRAGFSGNLSRADARRVCGLPETGPVILLLCNSYGPNLAATLLAELTSMPVEADIVAVVGRAEAMHRAARQVAERTQRRVRIVGFTETMWEWMRSADLAVTKAGGLTTAEALACGLPLVVFRPIPGQETRNCDYLLEIGAGVRVYSPRMVGVRVSELLSDPQRLLRLHQSAANAGRPNAAREIAADALRLL